MSHSVSFRRSRRRDCDATYWIYRDGKLVGYVTSSPIFLLDAYVHGFQVSHTRRTLEQVDQDVQEFFRSGLTNVHVRW